MMTVMLEVMTAVMKMRIKRLRKRKTLTKKRRNQKRK